MIVNDHRVTYRGTVASDSTSRVAGESRLLYTFTGGVRCWQTRLRYGPSESRAAFAADKTRHDKIIF